MSGLEIPLILGATGAGLGAATSSEDPLKGALLGGLGGSLGGAGLGALGATTGQLATGTQVLGTGVGVGSKLLKPPDIADPSQQLPQVPAGQDIVSLLASLQRRGGGTPGGVPRI